MKKTELVSFCTKSHADVWKLSSIGVTKFVKAEKFVVFVPEDQVSFFKKISPPEFLVRSENSLSESFAEKLRGALISAGNIQRYNWYLQQFLKIQSLVESNSDQIIIWDADCIPLTEINFFDSLGNPRFILSEEYHADYFVNLEKLLGMSKNNLKSFIGPGFPFLKNWVTNFILDIEQNNSGMTWHDAIIAKTDFHLMSGFSEFETLGTWVESRHSDEFGILEINWERFGQSKIGYAKNQNLEELEKFARKKNLDVISFENWDKRNLINRVKSFALLILVHAKKTK